MRCCTRKNAETRQLRSKRLDLAIENCYDAIARGPEEMLACIIWLQRMAVKQSCGGGVDGEVERCEGPVPRNPRDDQSGSTFIYIVAIMN